MRVAVTGIGMVNALGLSAPVVFNNLLNKVCGISSFYSNGELAIGGKPEFSKSPWRVHLKHSRSLSVFYAFAAATEALLQSSSPRDQMGLILDTCISPVLFHSLAASELSCSLGIFTSVDTKISILGSLDSFCTAISRIQNNTLSSVLLVGSQESLSPFYLNRLAALGLLNVNDNGNPSEAIRSFDINAKGMVLGEGAAAIVLESFEAVDKRGGKILAEVKGYGRNNDGKYLFKPEESGKGLQRACSIALKQANCTPDAVLADGSSLPDRDFVEVIGVNAIAKNKKITGIKANIGHMLGATGPSQIASAVMAVNQGKIFPIINVKQPICVDGADFINDCQNGIQNVLVAGLGFGGSNYGVVIGKA